MGPCLCSHGGRHHAATIKLDRPVHLWREMWLMRLDRLVDVLRLAWWQEPIVLLRMGEHRTAVAFTMLGGLPPEISPSRAG